MDCFMKMNIAKISFREKSSIIRSLTVFDLYKSYKNFILQFSHSIRVIMF